MSKAIKLRKFDVAGCKPFTTNIIVGKRGSGKSVLLRDIMYNHRNMHDIGVCCTPTMETADMFEKFVPRSLIYNDYNGAVLSRIVTQQRLRQEAGKHVDRIFIVLDDCGYEKNMFSSKNTTMRDIFMNGRHYKITLYICLQYCVDIPPAMRANTDYVYALREPVTANQKRLHDFFFGIVDTFANFKKIFNAATTNYECLVTANTGTSSNDLEDCLYWYKASVNLPRFRLCDDRYWRVHRRYYRTAQEMQQRRARKGMDAGNEITGGKIEVVEKQR